MADRSVEVGQRPVDFWHQVVTISISIYIHTNLNPPCHSLLSTLQSSPAIQRIYFLSNLCPIQTMVLLLHVLVMARFECLT